MDKIEGLKDLRDDIESQTSGLDISPIQDLIERLHNYLEEHDPDGEDSEDPYLGAAAALSCSLEDLESVIEDIQDSTEEADAVLDEA